VERVGGSALEAELRALSSLQVSVLSHVGLECFMAIEGPHAAPLAVLYDCLYAPLLYAHDRGAERDRERNTLYIEPEIVEEGMIADRALVPLVELYLRHYDAIRDDRRALRCRQVLCVLRGHEPVMAQMHPELRGAYERVKELCEAELEVSEGGA